MAFDGSGGAFTRRKGRSVQPNDSFFLGRQSFSLESSSVSPCLPAWPVGSGKNNGRARYRPGNS